MTTTPPASTIPPVAVDDVTAYLATTLRGEAWAAIDPARTPLLLNEAQRALLALCPNPDAEGCCGDFDAAWLTAVSELALALDTAPNVVISGAQTGPAAAVQSQALGELNISYYEPAAGTTKYGPRAPAVLRAFPWLGDILGCWLPSYENKASGILKVYRS